MQPFVTLKAVAASCDLANVDTDRIVPARFLRYPRAAGFGQYFFHDARQDPAFFINNPAWKEAKILVAAENFGCGSSREAAVWALADAGFRAWIAPSFGEIFHENSFKNGMLPIMLPAPRVAQIRAMLTAQPGAELVVDLRAQTIRLPDGKIEVFDIDPFRKECLLNGWDDIDLTLRYGDAIAAYEARQRSEAPWLAERTRSD